MMSPNRCPDPSDLVLLVLTRIDSSTVQLFAWISQGKSLDTIGKNALKLVKLPNSKMRRYSSAKLRKFIDVCMVRRTFVPPPYKRLSMSKVEKKNRGKGLLSQRTNPIFQKLSYLTILL